MRLPPNDRIAQIPTIQLQKSTITARHRLCTAEWQRLRSNHKTTLKPTPSTILKMQSFGRELALRAFKGGE
jgi:hypothetical protein